MRTVIFCAALSLALAAPVRAQPVASAPECSSHDHPCRLGLVGVTKCQVCHMYSGSKNAVETRQAAWAPSVNTREVFLLYQPLRVSRGDVYLSSHTRMCLSCHDGLFGPVAERCPRFTLATRTSISITRRMDCGVCHDPHLDNRVAENAKFLHHQENCGDCHEGRLFEEYSQGSGAG